MSKDSKAGGICEKPNPYENSKFSGMSKLIGTKTIGNKVPHQIEREKYDKYVNRLQLQLEEEYDMRENPNLVSKSRVEREYPTKVPKVKGTSEGRDVSPEASSAIDSILLVQKVNLKIPLNGGNHHTDRFELTKIRPARLIIRRGQTFSFSVTFNREYDPTQDLISLDFRNGPDPKEVKHTQVEFKVSEQLASLEDWGVIIENSSGNTVDFSVHVPANVVVGLWRLKINTALAVKPNRYIVHELNQYIYVIFNPWCKEDQVYMEDEALRNEYVLNDCGKIWVGEYTRNAGRSWFFGQFDHVVLPVCMLIMERTGLDVTARGEAVAVVRALSAGINSNDEGGVITGCWKSPYSHGTPPLAWTGSIAILDQFMKCGGIPVKYGQCWVFSGVTTSLCRALGIPARSVTNFVSAHDTDSSLCIERYFDRKGNNMNYKDSIWNFHVWNDVWMARPDLPEGYGGWQAIDATPQERSDGVYQTGPASLKAIQNGDIGFMYDTPFVFAEVNADLVSWHEGEDKKWVKGKVDTYHIGRCIMTRNPFADINMLVGDGEDIVCQYKPSEGSDLERQCVQKAFRARDKPSRLIHDETQSHDLIFRLKHLEEVICGQPFKVTLQIQNTSANDRDANVVLSCSTCTYTGALVEEVSRSQRTVKINATSDFTMNLNIECKDYIGKIEDHYTMKLFAVAKVIGTNQYYSDEDDFIIVKPSLDVQFTETPEIGKEVGISLSFTNPLPKHLTKCCITLEAPGVTRPKTVRVKDVSPNEQVNFLEKLTTKEAGEYKVVGLFHSNELTDIIGSIPLILK